MPSPSVFRASSVRWVTASLALALGAALPAAADEAPGALPAQSWTLVPGGRVWFEGDSTLHKYKAEAKSFFMTAKLSSGAPTPVTAAGLEAAAGQGGSAELRLPVHGLASGEGGLDKNMWKALKAEQNPVILFRMTALHPSTRGGQAFWTAEGTLSVAGVERPLRLEMAMTPNGGGIHLTGSQDLKMTDFGVKPPVLFAGTIKTADKITVHLDMVLRPV